eukprot:CAMPEP_0185848390 /NCGR_PEP_ID=MMETSP1354-20130828/3290_1 /TAXON_ID=708628 /ORGANISM="Erythrolobus madagascarensis, Strain CCMP3276" /LENGTH=199 /DNA_ID=CAMNT_0028548781 /DNA_START=81 /DNA_END=680 /DNA_ORIENTATION=-
MGNMEGGGGEIRGGAESGANMDDKDGAQDGVDERGFVCVGRRGALGSERGARIHKTVMQRHISVIRGRRGKLFCLDAVCYHAGGPLTAGNIEDIGSRECIVCPWHRYKIDMASGEGLYQDIGGKMCSKGKRQRTHAVEQRSDGSIWVQLSAHRPPKSAGDNAATDHKIENSDSHETLPSDEYAYGFRFNPGAVPRNETS